MFVIPFDEFDLTFASSQRHTDMFTHLRIVIRTTFVAAAIVTSASLGWAQGTTANGSVRVDGRERTYLIDLPPQYDGRTPLPVVVVFHGGGGRAESTRTQTHMSDAGRANGFIVVYPNGTGRMRDRLLTWNTGSCCGYARNNNVNDVAFVRAMLDSIQRFYKVDAKRIYATGLSNGGMMSHLMGCALSDRFAAIAPVSGELSVPCKPTNPVSVLIIHGTADKNLPYDGGPGERALERHDVKPVQFAVESWMGFDRCATKPSVVSTADLVHTTYAKCDDGTSVELYKIIGGPHAWPKGVKLGPGLDAPSSALDATKVIWAFFASHPKR